MIKKHSPQHKGRDSRSPGRMFGIGSIGKVEVTNRYGIKWIIGKFSIFNDMNSKYDFNIFARLKKPVVIPNYLIE